MIYTRAFIKRNKWHNRGLVYETHRMAKLEKYPTSRVENPLNPGAY